MSSVVTVIFSTAGTVGPTGGTDGFLDLLVPGGLGAMSRGFLTWAIGRGRLKLTLGVRLLDMWGSPLGILGCCLVLTFGCGPALTVTGGGRRSLLLLAWGLGGVLGLTFDILMRRGAGDVNPGRGR